MKIAILGAGDVGGTLGRRFAEVGHEVFFGVPNPRDEKHRSLADQIGASAQFGTVAQAAREAQIILLAVPYGAVADAIRECGDLTDKILIDATNPLAFADGALKLMVGFETSGAEQVAGLAGGAKVVKCFNQTGFGNMAEPRYGDAGSVMFVCGDDPAANETVRALAEAIGFEAVDAGRLEVARLLEPLAMLWIHLAFTTDLKRGFAFALLRKA
ncbi:MAG TPA: NADPH-dependent F420 reductase [Blastocatellia bacterium]|nr:NADPH-dependent F420 reductase [Blastocatellia bacterium]